MAVMNNSKAPTGPNPQKRLAPNEGYGLLNPGTTNPRVPAKPAAPPAAAPPPPPGPPAQPQPPTQQPFVWNPGPMPTTFDYSADPILQQITMQQGLAVQQAQSDALARQKADLIAYGDPNLAMSLLGDQGTAEAAAANPTSTLAQLAAQNKANVRDINESTNKQNLAYSSELGRQLGLNQYGFLSNQAQAAAEEQARLSQINSGVLSAKNSAADRLAQANSDAWQRAVTSWTNNQASREALAYAKWLADQSGAKAPPAAPVPTPTSTPAVSGGQGSYIVGGQVVTAPKHVPPVKKTPAPMPGPYIGTR